MPNGAMSTRVGGSAAGDAGAEAGAGPAPNVPRSGSPPTCLSDVLGSLDRESPDAGPWVDGPCTSGRIGATGCGGAWASAELHVNATTARMRYFMTVPFPRS